MPRWRIQPRSRRRCTAVRRAVVLKWRTARRALPLGGGNLLRGRGNVLSASNPPVAVATYRGGAAAGRGKLLDGALATLGGGELLLSPA